MYIKWVTTSWIRRKFTKIVQINVPGSPVSRRRIELGGWMCIEEKEVFPQLFYNLLNIQGEDIIMPEF